MHTPLAALSPTMTTLPAGDVEIHGRGPEGRPLLVGVEFKLIRDVLDSVRSGRFAEQQRRMAARYEVRWLLIEGEWQSVGGLLEVRERKGYRERGRYTLQEVCAWTLTMAQRAGVLLWRTRDRDETVAWLKALYWWWVSKDFEEHRAHLDWYQPPITGELPFEEPTVAHRVAAVLPGLGTERAAAAAAMFGTVRAMTLATEADWQLVPGVGAKTAKRVVSAIG